MRRRNVQKAFTGEPTGVEANNNDPQTDIEEQDDAVDFDVQSGNFMIVVPSDTPDDQIFQNYERFGANLTLEDGTIISISVEGAAVGVTFSYRGPKAPEAEPAGGLSAIEDVPGSA